MVILLSDFLPLVSSKNRDHTRYVVPRFGTINARRRVRNEYSAHIQRIETDQKSQRGLTGGGRSFIKTKGSFEALVVAA